MKKFYSLVLMAAMLLVGTNMWAAVHDTQQTGDVAKITIGSTVKYSADLKEAFDYVTMDQTATIDLLDHVSALAASITMPATINATDLANKAGQNITLKLNGKNISASGKSLFRLVKGTLNITGKGTLSLSGNENKAWIGAAVIVVGGHEDPTKTNWSNLTIGKDVTLSRAQGNGEEIGILVQDHDGITTLASTDVLYAGSVSGIQTKYGYCTKYSDPIANTSGYHMACGAPASSNKEWSQGSAFGVNITVAGTINAYKYGMKIQGHVNQTPICGSADDKFPNITLESTATVFSSADGGCCGIYASGYGVWNIKGTVYGASGIYAKAGEVTLKDANISSNSTTSATSGGKISGVGQAAGTAIVLESNAAYGGDQGVTISGDTKVEGAGGYAIYEQTYLTTDTDGDGNPDATTSHITIEGGTVESGNAGGIAVTVEGSTVTQVTGGNVEGTTIALTGEGGTTTGNTITVTSVVPQDDNHHTTVVTDENGKQTVVVSDGPAPQVTSTWADITLPANEGKNVNWNVAEIVTITTGNTVTLGELQMLAGVDGNPQRITIKDGGKLDVQHLIMNDFAQIVVEAGGKLIVQGEQGIVAKKKTNIQLQSSATKQAIFLFNPAVTSNREPMAMVDLAVAHGQEIDATGTHNVWTRYAMPVKEQATMWTKKHGYGTYVYGWDYEANDGAGAWALVPGGPTGMKPWKGYTLSYNELGDEVYTFDGNLVGNKNADLTFVHEGYNYFGNSYSAYIDAKTLVEGLNDGHIDGTVYMWNAAPTNEGGQTFGSVTLNRLRNDAHLDSWEQDIAPMATFILQIRGASEADESVNYNDAIWNNPRYGKTGTIQAPKRRVLTEVNEDAYIQMVVAAADGKKDRIFLTESAEYTDAYENGYDASKFMNEGRMNIYVTIDGENFSEVATDNLEGKTVSMQTTEAVSYTISFSHVDGNEYAMRDNVTGAIFTIAEGTTYEFAAQPNSTVEGRFEIINVNKMPTSIDNTEVKANVKGIYSITGMYLGEDFNALPAGVYVVDGVKIVK